MPSPSTSWDPNRLDIFALGNEMFHQAWVGSACSGLVCSGFMRDEFAVVTTLKSSAHSGFDTSWLIGWRTGIASSSGKGVKHV